MEPTPEYMYVKMNGTSQVRKFLVGEGRVIVRNGLGVEYENGHPKYPEGYSEHAMLAAQARDPNYNTPRNTKINGRLLVAVLSCVRDARNGNNRLIRDTWGKSLPDFADLKFFVGGTGNDVLCDDEIWVDAKDEYLDLPYKTRALFRWAFEHGYAFVYKCDTDTYVLPNKMFSCGFENYDYTGYFYQNPEAEFDYPSGGHGYFLSRKAYELVLEELPNHWAEDLWVGQVLGPKVRTGELTTLQLAEYQHHPVFHANTNRVAGAGGSGHRAWMLDMHRLATSPGDRANIPGTWIQSVDRMVVNLTGGLGNQMFQYAFGRSVALAKKEDVLFEKIQLAKNPQVFYGLDAFNVKTRFSTVPEGIPRYDEQPFSYNPGVYQTPKGCYYIGCWQTEKYFNEPVLRQEFTLRDVVSDKTAHVAEEIADCPQSAFIHVRRGCYLIPNAMNYHGVMSMDYYAKAMAYIRERTEGVKFFVFSDDADWCRQNFPDCRVVDHVGFHHVNGNHGGHGQEHEDLYLMSLCQHAIIANSSFGWWGAWLNPHKDRIVIGPRQWFKNAPLDTKDILPERWIKL